MENSQIPSLKPFPNPGFSPPPHRRRPLMSQACRTLLQILSYCPGTDSDKRNLDVCKDDNDSKAGKGNEVDKLAGHHLIRSENLLVSGPARKELSSDNLVVQQGSDGRNDESLRSGYENFTGARMEVDLDPSNHIGDAIEGDRGDSRTNDTNQSEVKEFDPIRQIELDKEIIIDVDCAAIEMCFGADSIAEVSQPNQITGEETPVSRATLSEEMEQGLRLKEMELESLISCTGATDSSAHVTVNENMEEGELSVDVRDELHSDIANDIGDGNKVEAEDQNNTAFGEEFIRNFGEEPEHNTKRDFLSKDIETRKVRVYDGILDSWDVANEVGGGVKFDRPVGSQFDATSAKKAKENKRSLASTEDADVGKKKRNRGPATKERRAKKKAKERIKRAEKNRKLGVKRLKLPPVMKPKVVSYCRHYLKGRCSEGEKCKFSHDIVPLTKSKPCSHFARQCCMKGDDCPFDHELSKYPCNNYATNGFCPRGAECLFSHKITAETAAAASSASNPELMSPSVPSNSKSMTPVSTYGVLQKPVKSTPGSYGLVPGKTVERVALEPVQKPASCAPKGVTFLSHGKPDKVQKPNAVTKGAVAGASQGINFLTFGRAPSAEPNGDAGSKPDNVQKPNAVIKAAVTSVSQGINFLTFGRAPSAEPNGDTASPLIQGKQKATDITAGVMQFRQSSHLFPAGQFLNQSAEKGISGIASSSKAPFLVNTPSPIQKALRSTLAFAAKFDPGVNYGRSNSSPGFSSASNHKAESSKAR